MLSIWINKLPFASSLGEAVKKRWPLIEKCIIAGPTLLGFVLGLAKHAPGEKHFEVGFQSLCLFIAYMLYLIAGQILDSVFFSSWPLVLGIWRSLGALAYLVLTIKQTREWLTSDVVFYPQVESLRARVNETIGNAG